MSGLVALSRAGLLLGLLTAEAALRSLPAELAGVFPNYDDPITAEPSLPHPQASGGRPCGTASPIVGAALSGYGQVVVGAYTLPATCGPSVWDQIVLELTGTVQGVQFDRLGALWLRGTEILRLTTPEPSPAGIAWKVVKDLSEYAALFEQPGEVILQIPTLVDSTYTGVLNINVSFSFYAGSIEEPRIRPHIMPLRNITGASFPFNSVVSNSAIGQVNLISLPNNIREAHLDLYASGHACEEFWYTNSLNATSRGCGGGAYRELNVFVDGQLAGAQIPFPVIYTGGVNPLLWRPLTGILSFNIPAYRFDLTPFLGWLNDGKQHNITVGVVNTWQGSWFLDGVLVLYEDPNGVSGGSVDVKPMPPRSLKEEVHIAKSGITVQNMVASFQYAVQGTLQLKSGHVLTSEVKGELSARSKNFIVNSNAQNTVGAFRQTTTSLRDGAIMRQTVHFFPLEVNDSSAEDNTTFQMDACVKFARQVHTTFGNDYSINFTNSMNSCAVYNRTTASGPRIVNKQTNDVTERFDVDVDGNSARPCYRRDLVATDGAVTSSTGHDKCEWNFGVYTCGSDLCGSYGGAYSYPVKWATFGQTAASGAISAAAPFKSGLLVGQCSFPVRRFATTLHTNEVLLCSDTEIAETSRRLSTVAGGTLGV